jgi:hypothetical protein
LSVKPFSNQHPELKKPSQGTKNNLIISLKLEIRHDCDQIVGINGDLKIRLATESHCFNFAERKIPFNRQVTSKKKKQIVIK